VLLEAYLAKDYFDVVDCDGFGLGGRFIGPALRAVKHGGLIYLTNTDGRTSSGKNPALCLANYGSWANQVDCPNEQGLRLLLGAVAQEAAVQRLEVEPVFSLYSPHGPVFRCMVRVSPTKRPDLFLARERRFTAHCRACGQTGVVAWEDLGCPAPGCSCAATRAAGRAPSRRGDRPANRVDQSRSSEPAADGGAAVVGGGAVEAAEAADEGAAEAAVAMSGPLWVGPLHDGAALVRMAGLAEELGWDDLKPLLETLKGEADPRLPPLFHDIHDLSKRAGTDPPPRSLLEARLRAGGYLATRTHVDMTRGVKTDAPMEACVEATAGADADAKTARAAKHFAMEGQDLNGAVSS